MKLSFFTLRYIFNQVERSLILSDKWMFRRNMRIRTSPLRNKNQRWQLLPHMCLWCFTSTLDTGTEAYCQIGVNAGQNNVFTKLFLVELSTRILSVLVYSEVKLLIILFNNYKWNKQLSSCSTFYPVGAESSQKARQIPQSARSTSCPLWQEAQCFLNPSAALH